MKSANTTNSGDDVSYYPSSNASFSVTANGRKPSLLEKVKIMLKIDSINYSLVMSEDGYNERDSRIMMQ